jgi:hypothetical protein
MRFVPSQESGVGCSPVPAVPANQGAWEQVLPTSKGQANLGTSKGQGWQPLSGKSALFGLFLAGGGGNLLELDPDGSYYVAGGQQVEPVDQGQWSLHGSDLTLTSSNSSTACSNGDKLVFSNLEEAYIGTIVFRGSVGQNTCHAAWTPAEWILVPNAETR